ncbi:geranylgeranyltransferase, putative [Plasmodium chabaudi adami]|uniref:Geranylgeranyl transferase type-2 subunit beta n=1 Tax=Plasmodium chabaudi adami TaxID=5826 RepID=A0A1C6Y6H5_PLACE|nr:geranylgeranyltransferase, putative [Plasmodium chabaudi adami]
MIFLEEKHIKYLNSYTTVTNVEELLFNETLKMCGVFYFVCSCEILSHDIDKKEALIDFILKCQNTDGGFGNNINYDSHIVSTHHAILSLLILNYSFDTVNKYIYKDEDKLNDIDKSNCKDEKREIDLNGENSVSAPFNNISNDNDHKVNKNIQHKQTIREMTSQYILSLLNTDGSVRGDIWGEVDTRFVYSAVSCLTILNKIHLISIENISSYLLTNYSICGNSFSWTHGNEYHAASVFCCVATLALIQKLYLIDEEKVAHWLSLRQTNNGGFNGRAEKLTDTCYSWWIFSSLIILKKYKWINKNALKKYILLCQDTNSGGISDNPDCLPDVCHTFFGLAALSLIDNIGDSEKQYNLKKMHPVYAIPVDTVKKRNLPSFGIDTL